MLKKKKNHKEEEAHLVVPPVGTCPNLLAILELVCAAQEVAAQIGEVVRRGVVQANDEECVVNDFQACRIQPVFGERRAETRPDLAVLGGEHANSAPGNLK